MPRGNPNRPKPEQLKKRTEREPTTCSNPECAGPLNGLHYFCRPCFMRAPAKLRVQLFSMHSRAQDCSSKVGQIARILAEEDKAKAAAGKFQDQGEPGPGVP